MSPGMIGKNEKPYLFFIETSSLNEVTENMLDDLMCFLNSRSLYRGDRNHHI